MSEQAPASRLWQVPDGDLPAALVAREEKLRTAYADVLEAVGEIDQRGVGTSLGFKDTSAFLTDALRISRREAKQRIDHAAATMPSSSLTGVPQPPPLVATGQALAAGTIGTEHAQAIIATFQACPAEIPPEHREADERILVDLARQAGPEAVRKACRRLHAIWEQETAPPADIEREQANPVRRLDIARRQDGSIRFTGELDAETAETLDGLLGPLAKPRKNPDTGEHDFRSPAERAGDALAEIIALAARCDELATQGGERAVMIVSVTLAELEDRARHALLDVAELSNVPGVSSVDGLRRLACESKVVPAIFGNNAAPLYVGDASRFATPAQRRYLTARDRGCAFPGCTRGPKWTTPHHAVPWSADKRTDVDNLVLLCAAHHRMIHHTAWEVRMNGFPGHFGVAPVVRTREPSSTGTTVSLRPRLRVAPGSRPGPAAHWSSPPTSSVQGCAPVSGIFRIRWPDNPAESGKSLAYIQITVPVTEPTPEERSAVCYGDEIVPDADVVFNRGFWLPASPEAVWPWLVQLGKDRAGWYLSRELEEYPWFGGGAGVRHLAGQYQDLTVGDVVPAWGGRNATQQVVRMVPPQSLVYRLQRRHTVVSWAITLTPAMEGCTRMHSRVRLGPVRHPKLIGLVGESVGKLAIGLLAGGLIERVLGQESII